MRKKQQVRRNALGVVLALQMACRHSDGETWGEASVPPEGHWPVASLLCGYRPMREPVSKKR